MFEKLDGGGVQKDKFGVVPACECLAPPIRIDCLNRQQEALHHYRFLMFVFREVQYI